MAAVGFACFGMNLVGVDADGEPCTPVFTYAANSNRCTPSSSPAPPLATRGRMSSEEEVASPVKDDVMERLRESLEWTGTGGEGGLEDARRRTGAPTHVSYAPAQLLRWLRATEVSVPRATVEQGDGEQQHKGQQRQRPVKVWQTLPSLVAARWCRLASAPVSYSEASWMGLLDLRKLEVRERVRDTREGGKREEESEAASPQKSRRLQSLHHSPHTHLHFRCHSFLLAASLLPFVPACVVLRHHRIAQWDAPTLSVLADAGFDCSALPRLADIGGLRAGVSGSALRRWPELDGASVRLGLGDGAAACLGSGCVRAHPSHACLRKFTLYLKTG